MSKCCWCDRGKLRKTSIEWIECLRWKGRFVETVFRSFCASGPHPAPCWYFLLILIYRRTIARWEDRGFKWNTIQSRWWANNRGAMRVRIPRVCVNLEIWLERLRRVLYRGLQHDSPWRVHRPTFLLPGTSQVLNPDHHICSPDIHLTPLLWY